MESIDPEGPFGAKECSEGSLAATIPAIANAIYDAVGVVGLYESPFTPGACSRPARKEERTRRSKRNHMFPMRCSHEPCKNIDVRSGRNDPTSEEAQADQQCPSK